jgi:hypothetical protein
MKKTITGETPFLYERRSAASNRQGDAVAGQAIWKG